jgi:hypothetical protein
MRADMDEPTVDKLRENVLAAQVEATLQGHELGDFNPVDGMPILGYEAVCSKCAMSVWVNDRAVYSSMPEKCPGLNVYVD